MRFSTKTLVRSAIIAAVYFICSVALPALSYGPLQFRVGEALTLLPLVFPEATVGLTIGCVLANIASPYGWADIVFGSLATLTAGILTAFIGKLLRRKSILTRCLVGAIPPVLVNAFVLPVIWLMLGVDANYWLNFAMMLATQSGTIFVLGTSLILCLNKAKLLQQ